MKRIIKISMFFLALIVTWQASAQESSYYRVGDTIFGQSRIYFYQWWHDSLLVSDSTRVLALQEWRDIIINTGDVFYGGGGEEPEHHVYSIFDRPHGEILQYCYTKNPLRIIGIASSAITGTADSFYNSYDYDWEPLFQEYFRLYDATDTSFVLLKEVPFNKDVPHRYMRVKSRSPQFFWGTSVCCYQNPVDRDSVIKIREFYFDSPVTVTDSFYFGYTTESHGPFSPDLIPNVDVPIAMNERHTMQSLAIAWDTTIFGRYSCMPECRPSPSILHKYKHIWWGRSPNLPYYQDTIPDTVWHWRQSPYFMLDFPIVIIDSSYIIPPPECPQVTNLRQADYGDGCITLIWNTQTDQVDWQVCYGPEGSSPEECTVIDCPIPVGRLCSLDSNTHYTAYVRASCQFDSVVYSQWSDPVNLCLCDTTQESAGVTTAMDALTYVIPNPASDMVQVLSSFSMNRVEVYGASGKLVADKAAVGNATSFSVKGWASGVYIAVIHTPLGIITKKLIVK